MKANIKIGRGIAGRITITFPYDPVQVAKIKAVEGSKWHPKEKYWSVPHSDGMVERVLSIFDGERVEIDASLRIREERDVYPKFGYIPKMAGYPNLFRI